MKLLTLLLVTLLMHCALTQTVQFTPASTGETLRNLILTDSKLLLGTSQAVYRVNLALDSEERRELASANRLLVADRPTGTLNGTVMACDEENCYLLETSNLANVKWEVPRANVLLNGGGNALGSFSIGPNGTSDITFGETSNGVNTRRVVKGALRNVMSPNPSEFFRYATNTGTNPQGNTDYFQNTFLHTNYTFFTVQPNNQEIRVVRFCQRDPGFGTSKDFLARYEIELGCRTNSNRDIMSSSAAFRETSLGPLLFVTVSSMMGTSSLVNDVCVFSVDQINQLMLDKLTACAGGSGLAGIGTQQVPCPTHFNPEQRETQIREPCVLRSVLTSGLEVDTPYSTTPIISTGMGEFTSLLPLTLDGSLFLFTGTTSGNLHQYHVTSDSESVFVRTIPVGGASVLKMLASDNGEYVYLMTSEKIIRHAVDRCNSYTSCQSCAASPDPVCGWCALRGQCTRQSLCSPVTDNVGIAQTIWIQNTDSCPAITMTTPQIIYQEDLASTLGASVEVTVAASNVAIPALLQFDYECQFSFSSGTSPTRTAVRSGGSFTCRAPLVDEVPPIPAGQDSVSVDVSLRVAGIVLATSDTPLEITDCSRQDSCTGCITSGVNKCQWCPFSYECIPDRQSAQCSNPQELTIGQNDQCPQIIGDSYRIHVDHQYDSSPLLVSTSDLSTFQNQFDSAQFQCVLCGDVECSNPLFTLPASLISSGTVVRCEALSYSTSLTTPELSVELRVMGDQNRRIDNPNNVRVILYDCNLMGGNCGQCLAISDEYGCSYCESGAGCRLEAMCQGAGYSDINQFGMCSDPPTIESFSPSAGPVSGGTVLTIRGSNLGADVSHISSVRVGAANCAIIDANYRPGVMLECRTDSVGSVTSAQITVEIEIDGQQISVTSTGQFSYKTPSLALNPANPPIGPQSGGSNITITGDNLSIGSTHSVTVGGVECVVIDVREEGIRCTTGGGSVGVEAVRVTVDNWSDERAAAFEYLEDPTFQSIRPNTSFASGGTNYTVTGTNFHLIENPRLLVYVGGANARGKRQTLQQGTMRLTSETCLTEGTTTLYCPAPPVELNGSSLTTVGFGLLLDNVSMVAILDGTLTVYSDPSFSDLEGEMLFEQGEAVVLLIQGTNFLFTEDQVRVRITPCETDDCYCIVSNITTTTSPNSMMCEVINPSDLSLSQSLTVTVHVGSYREDIGTIRVSQNLELLFILMPIIAAVIIISVVVLIVLVVMFCRNSRQKDQKYDQLILELEKLESSVARECKLGFAELQTDLDEITEIVGCRLPYRDMQSYLLTTLFPGVRDHTVLHPIQLPQYRQPQINRALEDFNDLIHDKKVLLLLLRSLEEERSFNIRDKSVVGSLLVVALINRFDYATDILKSLLSDLIHKTVANSSPKLLLRRTETVAERMLSNWLAFCLHGYIMEHVGQPLYLTYRAVKTQLEKGPIDVITGEARYSLSEQKLIRQKVDVEVVDIQVDSEDGLRVQVKLLDCDTISQVKEKLLDATYKTAPLSQRPSLKSVDLVYVESPTCQQILRDEDVSMEREGVWKRINTLKHYSIRNGSLFRLVRRKDHPGPGKAFDYPGSLISSHTSRQRALSEAEDGTRVWHLFKQVDVEDPRRSPFLNKKMVSEIYLPRMLSTKSILQKFVDDLFKSIFTVSHPPVSPTARYSKVFPHSPGVQVPMGYAAGADAVPMAVKYLFDFLDDEAEAAKISDPDVVHMWKNNALSLRFWVNMIKNPEFIFDVNKSHTVDACLSVIAQAFIDGCSYADTKLNIDSPTSKLLYNKEVQGYRAKVKQYYHDIQNLPRVPEDSMQHYLKQLSVYQAHMTKNTGGFVIESALFELLRYASKYSDRIGTNLRSAGLESKAQVFAGIIKVFHNQN